jgi:hypothetical protein
MRFDFYFKELWGILAAENAKIKNRNDENQFRLCWFPDKESTLRAALGGVSARSLVLSLTHPAGAGCRSLFRRRRRINNFRFLFGRIEKCFYYSMKFKLNLVPRQGIEPRLTDPESVVLPVRRSGITKTFYCPN